MREWYVRQLKAFTWGYFGWGSAAKHFVRAVDALEKKRGFSPPVFVDLRISRNVRAANFDGDAFEKIVGRRRYVWMKQLGNKRILSKKGKAIQIADPTAVTDLLDLIVELDKSGRRAIMYCSCLAPLLKSDGGYPSCHRVTVADLLLKAAKKRGLGIQVWEWPGETPASLKVKANEVQTKALANGARFIPIGPVEGKRPSTAVLGWGSDVRFETPGNSWTVVTGPAYVRQRQWQLEVVDKPFVGRSAKTSAGQSRDALLKSGYGPRS
jgi:hypothetical protein